MSLIPKFHDSLQNDVVPSAGCDPNEEKILFSFLRQVSPTLKQRRDMIKMTVPSVDFDPFENITQVTNRCDVMMDQLTEVGRLYFLAVI